jgi:hypothetical protein
MRKRNIMEKFKKRQHYVWRKYLYPWVNNNKIWCKRDDKFFNSALENIAQEHYFYLANPLNDFEKRLIELFIKKSHPTKQNVLSSIYDIYLASSEVSAETQKNGIENYHNLIENEAKCCIDKLYSKDLSVLEEKRLKISFCYYLGQQYMRTKRMIQVALKGLKLDENFNEYEKIYNSEKILHVLSLLIGENIGSWIYSNANFYFFETENKYEFITCDQPIYNLHEENYASLDLRNQMEFFYPISPHLSLFISSKAYNNKILTSDELLSFNKETKKKSYEIVFGSSQEILKKYC